MAVYEVVFVGAGVETGREVEVVEEVGEVEHVLAVNEADEDKVI